MNDSTYRAQWPAALAPLHAALLGAAERDAAAVLAAAERDGDAALRQARSQAASLLAEAAAGGEREARALVALDLARASREARAVTLTARRAGYDELTDRTAEAVKALVSEPSRRRQLVALALARLGSLPAEANVADTPDGGVLAVARDGRRVDASVAELTALALEILDVEQLWAP